MAGEITDNIYQAETEAVKIEDPGVGRELILRHFFFKATPRPAYMPKPSKLELVNQFKKVIEMSLWGDGLVIREDKAIEVHTAGKVKKISKALYSKMKEEGADFVILCLATPKAGVSVLEKPHILK